jgi:hypothetical protein
MIPGPPKYVACPRCSTVYSFRSLISGNTFGARYWSNGNQVTPMLPHTPQFTRCEECHHFFWLREGKVINPSEKISARNFFERDHLEMIESRTDLTNRDLVYLRTHSWWGYWDDVFSLRERLENIRKSVNEDSFDRSIYLFKKLLHIPISIDSVLTYREHQSEDAYDGTYTNNDDDRDIFEKLCIKFNRHPNDLLFSERLIKRIIQEGEQEQKQNLPVLINMLNESTPAEKLMKAEALRNLGEFKLSSEILASINETVVIKEMKRRITLSDKEVFETTPLLQQSE